MDELLAALQTGDEDQIDAIASGLLITNEGRPNYCQINEFEKYAPCKIVAGETDSFGWLTGIIKYNDKQYVFG